MLSFLYLSVLEELKSSVMRLELMSTDLREEREELQNKLNEQEDQTAACEHVSDGTLHTLVLHDVRLCSKLIKINEKHRHQELSSLPVK